MNTEQDRLIVVHGPVFAAAPVLDILDFANREVRRVAIDEDALVGFNDICDTGNGPHPVLIPLAIEGSLLMLRTGSRFRTIEHAAERIYVVNLDTGDVGLVAYSNP